MKKIFSFLLVVGGMSLLSVSCHEEPDPVVITSPYGKYVGVWTGTFTGQDSGTIEFTVKSDGSIAGEINSEQFPDSDLTLKGKVTIEGDVEIRLMYLEEGDTGAFIGTMIEKTVSGTWSNTSAGMTGSWKASRE